MGGVATIVDLHHADAEFLALAVVAGPMVLGREQVFVLQLLHGYTAAVDHLRRYFMEARS